jgi:hypothetical protein
MMQHVKGIQFLLRLTDVLLKSLYPRILEVGPILILNRWICVP